jgi:hypothetical protein
MNAIKLLILILTLNISYGFLARFNPFIKRIKINQIINSTALFDDEDKPFKKNIEIISPNISIYMHPVYTIIWNDCDDCKMLMEDMKKMHMEFEFINILKMHLSHGCEHDTPAFLLNGVFIGNTLFDMYEIMHSSMKY